MPGVRNKIIINDGGGKAYQALVNGHHDAIGHAMATGDFVSKEIQENGWLWEPEAKQFLADQETDCAAVDAAHDAYVTALAAFLASQMKRNDDMRLWVDRKLQNKHP